MADSAQIFQAVMLLTDETLKKIAHELTENLRQNLSVDWSERESVRAKLRLMVKRILRKYKYLKFDTCGTQVPDFIGNGVRNADYKSGSVRYPGVGRANSKGAKRDF